MIQLHFRHYGFIVISSIVIKAMTFVKGIEKGIIFLSRRAGRNAYFCLYGYDFFLFSQLALLPSFCLLVAIGIQCKLAKLAPRWRQDGPRWRQDGGKMAQDGAKMGQDGAKMGQIGAKMVSDGGKVASRWRQDGS